MGYHEALGFAADSCLLDDGEWYSAADLAEILHLGDESTVLRLVGEDERQVLEFDDVSMAVVSEPGMYSLLLRSDSETGRSHRRWLARAILPAIYGSVCCEREGQVGPGLATADGLIHLAQVLLEHARGATVSNR